MAGFQDPRVRFNNKDMRNELSRGPAQFSAEGPSGFLGAAAAAQESAPATGRDPRVRFSDRDMRNVMAQGPAQFSGGSGGFLQQAIEAALASGEMQPPAPAMRDPRIQIDPRTGLPALNLPQLFEGGTPGPSLFQQALGSLAGTNLGL